MGHDFRRHLVTACPEMSEPRVDRQKLSRQCTSTWAGGDAEGPEEMESERLERNVRLSIS